MLLPLGTTTLDMDSPTFVEDFYEAIGVRPGEKVAIMTPQFDRTDGMQVPFLAAITWDTLHKKDEATLRALGFGVWDETEKGKHWLFPKEWYDMIPEGYPITFISGKRGNFVHGETDDDHRFGCLAFGFIQGQTPEKD